MSPLLALARTAIRRPGAVLAVLAAASAAMLPGLLRLEIRTDGAAIYPDGDPAVVRTAADRETFREPDQIILLATSRPGGPLLASPAGFRFLAGLQEKLMKVPGLDPSGVRSLVTLVAPPEGKMERLEIKTFFDLWSGGEAGFPELLARIRRLPVANGLFLSAGGEAAPFYLSLAANTPAASPRLGRAGVLAAVEQLAARETGAPFALRVLGPVAAEVELGRAVVRDLRRLVPVMVLTVALLLALTLRTAGGVIVPLAQVLATLLWTLGLMGWCGIPVTLVTTVMPVLLMAMAMTDEIYLIERLQDHLAAIPAGGDRVRRALAAAFDDLWAPLALISLATAAGFFSFTTASMPPLRHFGLFTGLGLLLGMLFTFTLAPALLAVLPARWVERRRRSTAGLFGYERWTARHARTAALAGAAAAALAVPGLFRLRIEDSWIDNLDPRSSLATAERIFNRDFWGSYREDIVVQGDRGLFDRAAGMALLEELHRFARTAPHVGGAWSPLPLFEVSARALGRPLPISALSPAEMKRVRALTEVLRIRLSLDQILTVHGDAARVRLFVRNADYRKARELERAVAAELARLPAGVGVSTHVSGDVPVALAMVSSIVGNQLRSIAGTAVLIALMLFAAFRSVRLTAAVLAPVLAATLLVFAAMGYAGLPLGIATSMFAALTLGAGVDFAVQFTYAYLRERRPGRPHGQAVEETLRTTGRGLRCNAVVLALGIAVLAVSSIRPNASLGLLLAAAMIVSYAATLVFLPSLVRWRGE